VNIGHFATSQVEKLGLPGIKRNQLKSPRWTLPNVPRRPLGPLRPRPPGQLGCATGHRQFCHENRFTNQTLAHIDAVERQPPVGVTTLPKKFDEEVGPRLATGPPGGAKAEHPDNSSRLQIGVPVEGLQAGARPVLDSTPRTKKKATRRGWSFLF